MSATIFAKCVKAVANVAASRRVSRVVRSLFLRLIAPVRNPLGGYAKRADYIAVASSLSPPQ